VAVGAPRIEIEKIGQAEFADAEFDAADRQGSCEMEAWRSASLRSLEREKKQGHAKNCGGELQESIARGVAGRGPRFNPVEHAAWAATR